MAIRELPEAIVKAEIGDGNPLLGGRT